MDKKILNEDIQNMKYLFGYKPGRVISEQDHLEMDEEGKRHPERHVKHKKTNKTVGIFKKGVGFNPTIHGEELGFEFHPTDIPHGTTFGGTEIGDFDYEDDDFNSKMWPYDEDEEIEEGYEYDDVDEINPDDVEDDVFGDFDLSQLGFEDEEQDMENGEELYPSFSSDEEFLGMSKPNGDMDTEDEDTLFEQEEPETDRYMFFSNLQQIHRQTGLLLEKDPEMISNILENGHDWAQDHIATAKESIDQVFDFLMNEEKGDGDEDFEDNNI